MSDVEKNQPPRPHSTASSVSFSGGGDDGGGEADEDNSSMQLHNYPPSSTCSSSLNLHRQESNASQPGGSEQFLSQPGINGRSSSVARTTTISTIAMESNTSATSKCSPTRLVIALLQTPHQALHLKIIELSPALLKLPDTFVDAEDFCKNHSQVIKNLQSKQSPVEELLRQADSLIATQKPRAEVYAAMADSLGQTWKDLNGILEERRVVLELAYNCHKVIQSCVDRMNAVHAEYSKFSYIPSCEDNLIESEPQDVSISLKKLKEDRSDILKRVAQALDVCQQLLNKITDFNFSCDSRQLFLKRDVDYATKQVHRWLERLHDRRMLLEERLKIKRDQFEEMQDFLIYDREMAQLLEELSRLSKQSEEFSLGEDVDSVEKQRDSLDGMVRDMKMLQERALMLARKLEQGEQQKGKLYRRSGLKEKIYGILGTVNDLITDSIDFELSLVDAKEFFSLTEMATQKLDELGAGGEDSQKKVSLSKDEVNGMTYEALSKGQTLLDSLGWDSPRTRGVRAAYDNLSKRKSCLEDELEHLELLDEYNHFLESVNQAYQNILNVETSFLRQHCQLPVDIPGVLEFQRVQNTQMDSLPAKTNFQQLLQKLEQIYPNLSEEEKVSTEEKVNQLKYLSNLVVELILQRTWVASEWLKVLQLDKTEWEKIGVEEPTEIQRLTKICDNISALYAPIQQQIDEVHRSDPDLDLSLMEGTFAEIIKKYRDRAQKLATGSRIRDICQVYKGKLDQHLLGDTVGDLGKSKEPPKEPCYFPVLSDNLVGKTLREESKASAALDRIIKEQTAQKLEATLTDFFQPLITNFRQEILQAEQESSGPQTGTSGKTTEELSWERYFERLKESYVRVTKQLEHFLGDLKRVCEAVEQRLDQSRRIGDGGDTTTIEIIEKELTELTNFRKTFIPHKMESELKQKLDQLLSIIGHEEPPIQAEQEERTLRNVTSTLLHDHLDGIMSQQQDTLTRQLTEKMIHKDLDMINHTLNDLISELEHPCNYGNNLADAQAYLASFERFERTVETLRDKLSRLLTTAGMSETDQKAQNLLAKLNLLVDRKGKRRELILQSLEYFRLIDESYEHYNQVNRDIDEIIAKSKSPQLSIPDIEGLLTRIGEIKSLEADQERRLEEIERISKIIFDVSQDDQTKQHFPLRDQSTKVVGDILRVETDLTILLQSIKSKTESQVIPHLSDLELELQSQIVIPSNERKVAASVASTPVHQERGELKEVIEELIIPTRVIRDQPPAPPLRPKSQEMCTQTSSEIGVETDAELEARTLEYLKEKERMTVAVLDALRQSMSPLPPPQTVEKETQFEVIEEEPRPQEKIDRDTITQTISESVRSFETQTESVTHTTISTETEELLDLKKIVEQQQQTQIPQQPVEQSMFIQPLKDLVVNEGDKVVLECKTAGQVEKIVWLKDGLEIHNNPDYKTTFVGSIATLTIDEALPEDSAIFTCRAFGDATGAVVVETSGRLSIREPVTSLLVAPSFLPHPSTSQGNHGSSHVISVKVEGNPLPTVAWFRDGECIDTSPDYIITFNNGLCQVLFDELVAGMDDGVYTCVAQNKLGDAETSVTLSVIGDVEASKKLNRQPPRIIQNLPKNLIGRAGQRVKLECEWESPSECSVVWIKDDIKILTKSNSAADIIMETPTKSTLSFSEAYPVNSGKYSILVRNSGGEVQSDCQLIVKGLLPAETSDSEVNVSDDGGLGEKRGEDVKPLIKMALKDWRGRVGEPLKLDCVIVGNPEPEVIWYRDGVPLKEGKNLKLIFHGDRCSLVVDKATLQDNGIYSVSALNNVGEASDKCQVWVAEKTPEEAVQNPVAAPVFKKIIQDEMVTAGNEFEMSVELEDNPGAVTDVTWWKNNGQIRDSSRIRQCKVRNEYRLLFKEIDLSDKGNYMVKAVNSGGDARCFGCLIVKENFEKAVPDHISTKEIEQPVQQPPAPKKVALSPSGSGSRIVKAPRFVIPLEGKMVDEGERNLSLKCKVDASPAATVKWTKNNGLTPLEPNSNVEISYNERNGEAELKILNVAVKDGGRYTCHAANEHGLASSVSDLVVKKTTFPPVFSKRLQSTTVQDGKRIYLEVDVFGKPSPSIQWYHNGTQLSANDQITMKSDSPTRHTLIIGSGKKNKWEGSYKVIARNDAGEAESSCVVTIVGQGTNDQGSELSTLGAARLEHLNKVTTTAPGITKETMSSIKSSEKTDLKVTKDDDVDTGLVESTTTTTTIITSTEERLFERVTQVMSPVPSPELATLQVIRQIPKPTSPVEPPRTPVKVDKAKQSTLGDLVPGPEPEILVAAGPQTWSQSKLQVLEKVKRFEEEVSSQEPHATETRIIPIRSPSGSAITPGPGALEDTVGVSRKVEPAILPNLPSPGWTLVEPPKITQDSMSTYSHDVIKSGADTTTTRMIQEQHSSQSSQAKYIKPSKFIPESMRESDHDSGVESSSIAAKWTPSTVQQPVVTTTSAFVPVTSTPTQVTAPSTQTTVPPPQVSPVGVKSLVKLWPPSSASTETSSFSSQQTLSTSSTMFTTTIPPQPQFSSTPASNLSTQPSFGGCRLSPIGFPPDRVRSPTPNKEGLEMDKLWARPIRFSSPATVPASTIPASTSPIPPSPTPSPYGTLKKKPEVPPKPASSWMRRTTPTPYSPVSSPIPQTSGSPMLKPEVPPKPAYAKSSPTPYSPQPSPLPTSRPVSTTPAPESFKEPVYFVSTVSTPRTTPVPPQLSGWTSPLPTTPEVPFLENTSSSTTYSSSFHEKRDFFESTTSYSNMEESSSKSFTQHSSSSHATHPPEMIHPSGISLLDQSLLPPPGEPPVFMYAPPPVKPSPKPTPAPSSIAKPSSSSVVVSSSSTSSSTSQVQVAKSGITTKQEMSRQRSLLALPSSESAASAPRTQPIFKPAQVTPRITVSHDESISFKKTSLTSSESMNIRTQRRHDVPRIRPSKFVPVLDYFSSSSDKEESTVSIKPKWKPGETQDSDLSSWRKVTYEVPRDGGARSKRRDSLSSLMDKNMQEINKQFKANISQLSQGLCYNHTSRNIQSDLGGESGGVKDSGPSTQVSTKTSGETENANPLIYFKYDFGYEFGIACPRAQSEPPQQSPALQQSRPTSWVESSSVDDKPISLPIIHETSKPQ